MKRQRKASGTLYQDTLPMYFKGDQQLLTYLQLRFQTTINLQKPHIVSLPLKLYNHQKQDFIQPLAQIQTIDEISRQAFMKNSKSMVKEGVFYVYFPSNIRVDQKIFKIYDKNYQSLLKEVPKIYRQNFAKFIIWQNGTGQQTIQAQKNKLQQLLSNTIKNVIQKKIQLFTIEIAALQGNQLNQKILQSLFVARNKISSIYKQLKIPQNAAQHLSSIFNQILHNYKKFLGVTSSKQISTQKIVFKSPFIIKNINTIFSYFDNKQNFLQIANFCFLKVFQVYLDLLQQAEAMKKFKNYLDYVLTNIMNSVSNREQDIAKNIWIIQTIDEGLKVLKGRNLGTIMNSQKLEQYSLMNVSICSQYRNAIQRIGVIYYGLNTYCIFPRNLQYELKLCIKCMKNQPLTQEQYPELKILNRHLEINKLLFLSGEPLNQTIQLIMNNFQSYKIVLIRTLQLMQKTLSDSPYRKVSWSMKLSVLKSSIIYFTLKDEKKMCIDSLLEQDRLFSYQTKKSVWQKLEIVNKVYRLTLSKRYNIKMSVQDLLNIVLDSSIIHLQDLWREIVKIISQILFEYKRVENQEQAQRLNSIDYGQNQEQQDLTKRKRRRTTIHHSKKQIQVGTLKFITLVQNVDQIIQQNSNNIIKKQKNDSVKLNIELSNRIVSYAVALIQKSKEPLQKTSKTQQQAQNIQQIQQKTSPNKSQSSNNLIQLKFLIKTLKNQQMIIPFEIIQTQDKFIEVQIKSTDVLLFKIQKLMIDISDCITLVYTMPINHDKIQQYEKRKRKMSQNELKEETFYANISPQLKINTVLLHEPQRQQKTAFIADSRLRKQSTSSTTSRPNSQSSAQNNFPYTIFKKLWTPIKFSFSFDKNDQIQIQRVEIQCLDEVYEKIFIGEKQVDYRQPLNIKINSDQQKYTFPLIVFIKPSEKIEPIKESSQFTASTAQKKHKQSFNLLPKSLRNRAQSIAKSINSGNSSLFPIDSTKLCIKLYVTHKGYKYQIKRQIGYGKQSPFRVDYRYAQQFQQYTIKNICNQQLQIGCQNQIYWLFPFQQMKVFSPLVRICLKYKDEENNFRGNQSQSQKQQDQEQLNLMKVLKLDNQIDLKTMIKKQHLKPEKVSTIWLSLQQKSQSKEKQNAQKSSHKLSSETPHIYNLFEPIRIISQQKGFINVLKWNTNQYELVGKIEGQIDYVKTDGQIQNALDLMMVPTKKGNISMPEILINSRKGVWKHGKTIRVG